MTHAAYSNVVPVPLCKENTSTDCTCQKFLVFVCSSEMRKHYSTYIYPLRQTGCAYSLNMMASLLSSSNNSGALAKVKQGNIKALQKPKFVGKPLARNGTEAHCASPTAGKGIL